MRYAADDPRYLGPLADLLREELKAHGRLGWHGESCRKMLSATKQNNVRDNDGAWRIRGLGHLDRQDLAFLRELWRWRDAEAQGADKPPFKILGNEQLIKLAEWASSHTEAPLSEGPRLPRHCEGERLAALEAARGRAGHLSKAKWPEKRPRRDGHGVRGNDSKKQIEALRTACAEVAHGLQMPASLLAPKAMLVAIVRARATTPDEMKACSGMMDWQVELLQEPVREVLSTVAP